MRRRSVSVKMNGKCFLLGIIYGGEVGPEGRVRFKFQKQGKAFSPHIVNIPSCVPGVVLVATGG